MLLSGSTSVGKFDREQLSLPRKELNWIVSSWSKSYQNRVKTNEIMDSCII